MKKFLVKTGLTAVVLGLILHWLLGASLAQTTSPNTYYVSPSGSDSYTCAQATSEATPKETINNAITCLRPGETLLIKDGTYIAQNQLAGIPSGISWTAPVTIAAYPGSHPVLYAQQSGYDVIRFVGNSYIIIDGLIIDAAGGKNGVAITYPDIDPTGSAHHIRIINCEIRNAPFHGILVAGVNAQFNEFINLDVHDNGVDPGNDHGIYISASNNLVEGSAFFRNASHGIHIYGDTPNNNVVRFNLSYDNSRTGAWGAGIGIYTGSGNLVYNNIVWGNNDGLWINYDVSDSKIYNNTIYSNADYGLLIGDATTGSGTINNIIRNNIVIGGRLGVLVDAGIATTLSNNLTTDPKFVNAAGADFHLQADSPAIDAGIAIAEVTTDFDGIARPQGTAYDIGAYEHANISPPPVAPSSNPAVMLSYDGMARDRVGPGEFALTSDGQMDGTFTVTLQAGSGNRTVTRLDLNRSGSGIWDTEPNNGFWQLGAANALDNSLYNAGNGTVSFPLADGGSFKIFASDYQGLLFVPGSSFTLTVSFADGSMAAANFTLNQALPPPLLISCSATSFQASADFSPEQGQNCWYYLTNTEEQMVFVPSSNWWNGGGEQHLIVGNNWQHPGANYDSVRRWVAAQAGTVHVTGAVSRPDPNGDGVLVTIKHNGLPIWQSDIPPAGAGIPFDLTESVAIGDNLDFVVNKKGDNSYDSTTFDPTIVLNNTFSSPPPVPNTPPPSPSAPTWPSAPINLVAQCSADGTQATVSWSGVNYATAYALRVNYLGNDGSGCLDGWYCSDPPDNILDNYGGTSYVANVTPNQPYNFWVHGMQGGNYGNAGSSSFTCDGPLPPSNPPLLISSLNLTWQDNSTNEDGFQIERKLEPGGLYIQIASVTANINFHVDTDTVSGTTYCYRVRAVNSSEISGYTNEACATAP